MSKGMYCSAASFTWVSSSSSGTAGSVIFLTITECPEMDVATRFSRIRFSFRTVLIAVTTLSAFITAPSTIASGSSDLTPNFCSTYRPLASFICTALMQLEPISNPSKFFSEAKKELTSVSSRRFTVASITLSFDQRPTPRVLINCLISRIFWAVYVRQFRQSRGGSVISPARSQRNSVARETSYSLQTWYVLYRFALPPMPFTFGWKSPSPPRQSRCMPLAPEYSQYNRAVKEALGLVRSREPARAWGHPVRPRIRTGRGVKSQDLWISRWRKATS